MTLAMDRREFLGAAGASAAAFTLVPRHVLGGPGYTAPSDQIALALVGCGTQGLMEMLGDLELPEIRVVAVCDPNRDSNDYVEWGPDSIRGGIAGFLGKSDWRQAAGGCPGGRDVGREIVEAYYGANKPSGKYRGCAAYADFRELLEKEKGLDAVRIMTPDHLHATIAIAAMKKGRHVLVHKPLANRLSEARLVIETARKTKVATHFLPARSGDQVALAASWIRDGAIGTLREVHNWSNRPVWPQYPTLPADTPAVPDGFDWDLWLGPSPDRPYHPHFTHAVFRGWYEFGGGAIADMGHYSLWSVFTEFDLDAPVLVESTPSHVCTLDGTVSRKIENDYSFPAASTIRFRFAAKGSRPAMDIFWYDGGIRPRTPEELEEGRELPAEGMLLVGDKGKILAGFSCDNPRLIPERKFREYWEAKGAEVPKPREHGHRDDGERPKPAWVEAFRGGGPTYGNFLLAGPISEAVNLAAVSLRLGGKKLAWDSAQGLITNLPEANQCLTREYRKGWELTG